MVQKDRSKKRRPSYPVVLPGRLKKVNNLVLAPVSKSHLNSALAYLRHETRCNHDKTQIKAERYCWPESKCNVRCELEEMLPSYQMLYFVRNIRNAILSHEWDTALDLLLLLLEKGKKFFTKYFVRACLPIVFHHPRTTPDFLYTFFETVTGYGVDKEVEKFIVLLFRVKENARSGAIKHRSKSVKLIDDAKTSGIAEDSVVEE